MIRHLTLNNLVLVDSCYLDLKSGFYAITGETGSGKSVLLEAISLVLGQRADSELIRKGCDKADVEICFGIEQLKPVHDLLDDAGISSDSNLIIRRELSKEGKNRAFVNCRMVPLPFLQKMGTHLIDVIDQHAHHAIRHSEAQRQLLDLFGNLGPQLRTFQRNLAKERQCKADLEALNTLQSKNQESIWRFQLEEIETAALKKNEDEEVFAEYQKVVSSKEFAEKTEEMTQILFENSHATLPQVSRCIKLIDSLCTKDPGLKEISTLLHESHIALAEVHRNLQSYKENLEADPHKLTLLENRLSTIAKLKKKYGPTFEEIEHKRENLKKDLLDLSDIEEKIRSTEAAWKDAQNQTNQAAEQLTALRKQAALQLQDILTLQLQDLNMPQAEVHIDITSTPRHQEGNDCVQFYLKANPGEERCLVKDHASGGELSRLLFAIKIAFAEKNNTPTLLFDEIDANVGGKTATIMGEKLKELGKHRQVFCITHFPQVALKADHHLSVQKKQQEGRTCTEVLQLTGQQVEQELLRMRGGETLLI